MTTAAALVVALGSAALPAVAAPADPPPSRSVQTGALLALLRAPHPQIEAHRLARIGPDVNAILVEFATSPRADPGVRLRALAWLQHFATPQSRAVLLDALRARDAQVAVQRIALRALASAFGVEIMPVVRHYLESRDLYVREAAAYALGDIADRRVRDILVDHLDREPEVAVRDAVMASLARYDERQARPPEPRGKNP